MSCKNTSAQCEGQSAEGFSICVVCRRHSFDPAVPNAGSNLSPLTIFCKKLTQWHTFTVWPGTTVLKSSAQVFQGRLWLVPKITTNFFKPFDIWGGTVHSQGRILKICYDSSYLPSVTENVVRAVHLTKTERAASNWIQTFSLSFRENWEDAWFWGLLVTILSDLGKQCHTSWIANSSWSQTQFTAC